MVSYFWINCRMAAIGTRAKDCLIQIKSADFAKGSWLASLCQQYSEVLAVSSAFSIPNKSAITASAISIPAETPDDV